MYFASAFLFIGLAMGRAITPEGWSCNAPLPTEEQLETIRGFADQEAFALKAGRAARAPIYVDVWIHAVSASEAELVSDEILQGQFDTLYTSFLPNDIHLNYAGSTRTVNADWANDANGQQVPMKQSLREGDYRTLNFYIIDTLPTASGYCTLPTVAPEGSDAFIADGCTLAKGAVGLIGTHEAGHWFGLLHTFDGNNCDGPGDLVDDTPAQSGPLGGCPVGRDSCPNHPGLDPITNYMDYTSP